MKTDSRITPESFLRELCEWLGLDSFDVDPCPCVIDGHVISNTTLIKDHLHYNLATNPLGTLETPWAKDKTYFINPPFSRGLKEAFVLKAIEEAQNSRICILLPDRVLDQAFFHDALAKGAVPVFVRKRIKFASPHGFNEGSPNFGCFLLFVGAWALPASSGRFSKVLL
jgi:hypothetical protein